MSYGHTWEVIVDYVRCFGSVANQEKSCPHLARPNSNGIRHRLLFLNKYQVLLQHSNQSLRRNSVMLSTMYTVVDVFFKRCNSLSNCFLQ